MGQLRLPQRRAWIRRTHLLHLLGSPAEPTPACLSYVSLNPAGEMEQRVIMGRGVKACGREDQVHL